MALNNKTYTLSDYAETLYTTLVPIEDDFIMATLVLANDSTEVINVEVELIDAEGFRKSLILPSYALASKESQVLDVRSINVDKDHALRVKADLTGVHFTACGALEVL